MNDLVKTVIFLIGFSTFVTNPKQLELKFNQMKPLFEDIITTDVLTANNRKRHDFYNQTAQKFNDLNMIKIIGRYCRNSCKMFNDQINNYLFEKMEICSKDIRFIKKSQIFTTIEEILDNILNDELDVKNIFQKIDKKRGILLAPLYAGLILDEVKEYIYHLQIYHTIGISRNTITIEELRYILKTGRAVHGKSIREHNEVMGIELAIKYIKTLCSVDRIGLNEILEIHRRVMGYVDPLSAGIFRDAQWTVASHSNKIEDLMEDFIKWLNSEEINTMHPVKYAALAYMKLFQIHPFDYGNGRTSRLLMNLVLLRAGFPPMIILKDHQKQYYEYFKSDMFVDFIAQSMENVLDFYLCSVIKELL